MKYLKVFVVASVTAVVLAGCGADPAISEGSVSQPSMATGTASSKPTVAQIADGTEARPFEFGVFATSSAKSRWDVTLTEVVVSDGSAQVLAENPYNEVKDGWEYVLGRMTSVVNEKLPTSDTGAPVSPTSVMPVFIGSDGKVYDIWNDNSAVVLEEDWVGQPEIIARPGIESTGRFAIQVPISAISGGRFATRNEVNQTILYFGAPVE